MKSAELKIGTNYAVIPAWDYSSSDKKNPDRVQRNHVAKATLVSSSKYEYKVYRSDKQDDAQFAPANKGSRNVGYLVCSDDYKTNGQAQTTIYWLARPYHERVSASLIASLKTILGDRANNITVDQRNRRVGDNYIEVSEMSIDLKTMSILVEKVLEAKDLVG
jgi:hypothetical protein